MENKNIIVRITDILDNAIKYFEESYKLGEERFYTIKDGVDSETAKKNNSLECPVAFVIFGKNTSGDQHIIKKIYMGMGKIKNESGKWKIIYLITLKSESELLIDNFISTCELDIRKDFEFNSFLHVEKSKKLKEQIIFLIKELYKPVSEDKCYHQIDGDKKFHEYSQKNQWCKRIVYIDESDAKRSEFQRDYERIIHAKAFRRLVDKAQIFTSAKGDHYRTRMTHTLEVAQIARAIAIKLNLNVDLAEAIALAHDIGHTPFGHQGERTLDKILKGKKPFDFIKMDDNEHNSFGGFKHNFQGLRVVGLLEEKYIEYEGLNLSYQVLEGILKHTGGKIKDCDFCDKRELCDEKCFDLDVFTPYMDIKKLYKEYKFATTLEGQIVAIADEIAQRSHDLDDSFAAKILTTEEMIGYLDLRKMAALKEDLEKVLNELNEFKGKNRAFINEEELRHSRIVSSIIHFFINDVVNESKEKIEMFKENEFYINEHRFNEQLIDFSQNGKVLCRYLEKIISKKVINSTEVVQFDNKAEQIVCGLFKAYYNNPRLLHTSTLRRLYVEMRKDTIDVIDFLNGDRDVVDKEINKIINDNTFAYINKRKILVRTVADYIAGMTDSYAINEYKKIYI